MEHYYLSIFGWFHATTLFREMVRRAKSGAKFLEIGAFKGQSAAFMGVEIENSGKEISFYSVDNFSLIHKKYGEKTSDDMYAAFLKNIQPVSRHVIPMRMSSLEAVTHFADESLDFVYIDGDHRYDAVMADIAAWLPKVKTGGILATITIRGTTEFILPCPMLSHSTRS